MATISWTSSNGDWDTASNWSGGTAPTSSDIAVISTASAATITHSSGLNDSVASLSVGLGDTLDITSGGITVASGGSFAGTLLIDGGIFVENGGMTLSTLAQNTGTLSGSGVITVTGAAALGNIGNLAESGSGTTVLAGATILGTSSGGSQTLNLDGGRTLLNSGTFTWESGDINLGFLPSGTPMGGATIHNAATGCSISRPPAQSRASLAVRPLATLEPSTSAAFPVLP